MSKIMSKEVKTTIAKITKVTLDEKTNSPVFERVEDIILIGHLTKEKAISLINKQLGFDFTLLSLTHQSNKYKMKIEDFILFGYIDEGTKVSIDIDEDEERLI